MKEKVLSFIRSHNSWQSVFVIKSNNSYNRIPAKQVSKVLRGFFR